MTTQLLRIVVASPGDVQAERDSLEEITDELNRGIAADRGLQLVVSRWETDAYPGFHQDGPQGLIDPILRIQDCDVLIGIFWKRLGTPTKDARSGTEHEIRTAIKAWEESGRPQVMVYFNFEPHMPTSKAEVDQLGQVTQFREEFSEKGLWWKYEGREDFKRKIRQHLTNLIRQTMPLPISGLNKETKTEQASNAVYKRIVQKYRSAIPYDEPFVWNAARGQLLLFAELGVKEELARRVIAALDGYYNRLSPTEEPLHIILFVGHRVDEPNRLEPRFPGDAEPRARELIRDALRERQVSDATLKVLASAAPGSDIICHEVCKELGIDSTVCLPMPPGDFARLAFSDLDSWRSRFLKLVGERQPLVLSNQEGLPRWLQGSGLDPWERGNRWVLEMAQTSGARKVTLLALWDGKDAGDAPGGTAHMVRIAREAGMIDVVTIPTGKS